MREVLFWLSGFILWRLFLSGSASPIDQNQKRHVLEECSSTRYPDLCAETILRMGNNIRQIDVLSALVNKTLSETKSPSMNFGTLSSKVETKEIKDASKNHFTGHCKMLLSMSIKRLDQSLSAINDSPKKCKQDIQAWLSAALTYQQACKDSMDSFHVSSNDPIMGPVYRKIDYLSQLASNSLSLVNKITNIHKAYNNATGSHHTVEENIFPNWVSRRNRKLLQANIIKADAIVAQDGSGKYKNVSEAIQAASGNRHVIHVKAGIYKEKIRTNKDGIVLIGDGKYSTIITWHDSASSGSSMPDSATFSSSSSLLG